MRCDRSRAAHRAHPSAAVDLMMLAALIKTEAARLGFDLAGVAPAVTPAGINNFLDWLDSGYAGGMEYMARRKAAYQHPQFVLAGAKSVVMLAANYHRRDEPNSSPEPALSGRVSRYARGDVDYHDLLRGRLRALARFVNGLCPGGRTRGVVDTAPLLERDFARLAGLGWFGKNTMLLNTRLGSWFFLAALLLDVELEYDPPHATAHCGTCTRCLDLCPTQAFVEPYVLDARKCISYLTIEHREPIPPELREPMGQWLFGCDVCQDVCPWNTKVPVSGDPAFLPRPDLTPVDAAELLSLDDTRFRARFQHSPLARPGRAGLLRNAAIVLGNSGDRGAVGPLVHALDDAEPLIRGAAAWALGRLGGETAITALESRLRRENDAAVQAEIVSGIDYTRAGAMVAGNASQPTHEPTC